MSKVRRPYFQVQVVCFAVVDGLLAQTDKEIVFHTLRDVLVALGAWKNRSSALYGKEEGVWVSYGVSSINGTR